MKVVRSILIVLNLLGLVVSAIFALDAYQTKVPEYGFDRFDFSDYLYFLTPPLFIVSVVGLFLKKRWAYIVVVPPLAYTLFVIVVIMLYPPF